MHCCRFFFLMWDYLKDSSVIGWRKWLLWVTITVLQNLKFSFLTSIFIRKPAGYELSVSTKPNVFILFSRCSCCSLLPHVQPDIHASPMKTKLNPKNWIRNIMNADVLESPLELLLYYQWGQYMPTGTALWDLLLENSVMSNLGTVPFSILSRFSCSYRRQCSKK